MRKLTSNHFYLIWVYVFCFFAVIHSDYKIQDAKKSTLDVSAMLKHMADKGNQQIEKDKKCEQANITYLNFVPDDNAIKVSFKLQDEKFQDCFKYFKIILKKKRKEIKVVTVPYFHDRQTYVTHKFENISCGSYEISVQPCFTDMSSSCPTFKWIHERSINVTSNNCIDISTSKIADENETRYPVLNIFITQIMLITLVFGILIVLRRYRYSALRKKMGYESCVAEPKIAIDKEMRAEIKSITIYIFHMYDKSNIIPNKVYTLGSNLNTILKYLYSAIIHKDPLWKKPSLEIFISTINSELDRSLNDVDGWLNDALKKRGKDNSLQKVIWIKSGMKEEEDDIVENEIFSYITAKLENNDNVHDNLLDFPLDDMPMHSESQKNILSGSSYTHRLFDICFDICSEFIVPKRTEYFELLFRYHINRQSIDHQDLVVTYYEKLLKKSML